jgi:hypothetical protein
VEKGFSMHSAEKPGTSLGLGSPHFTENLAQSSRWLRVRAKMVKSLRIKLREIFMTRLGSVPRYTTTDFLKLKTGD